MVWKGLAEGWENGLVGCGVCREEESELAAKGLEGAEDGGKEGAVKAGTAETEEKGEGVDWPAENGEPAEALEAKGAAAALEAKGEAAGCGDGPAGKVAILEWKGEGVGLDEGWEALVAWLGPGAGLWAALG